MKELTSVGNISQEAWEARFNDMKQCKDTYFVVVIEDTTLNKVCVLLNGRINLYKGIWMTLKTRNHLKLCLGKAFVKGKPFDLYFSISFTSNKQKNY